ncbi:MAG: Nif3-like dinuclear metal center hexameric protein [Vulcanibacillus sp.]
MPSTGQFIIQIFEQLAPKYFALADDKIGLQIGTLYKDIKKIMLTLDILENVVDDAIEKKVDLIISHHPLIYKPLKNIRTDLPQGRVFEKLIKNNISVYVAHTNLDVAVGGVNDVLAKKIGLLDIENLETNYIQKYLKLVVYVPKNYQQKVFEAISNNGAGWIGNYSHCTFNINGTGTFKPLDNSTPFIGKQGKLENVDEVRIETIIPENKQAQIIKAMIKAHPYEEVAYDLYQLENIGNKFGIGRKGVIPRTLSLKDFALLIKEQLNVEGVKVVGNLNKLINKVAIVGGDGDSYVNKAAFVGVDVLITGDIYYHTAHEAMANDLALIDVGHHTEKLVFESVKNYLETEINKNNLDVEVLISEVNTNPFKFL